jgi:hypothetical protein
MAPVAYDLYPPDFTTELGQLRALIPDVEQVDYTGQGDPSYLFTDGHLRALLGLYMTSPVPTSRVKRAAADALTAIAVSEALISKVIKTDDLQTDGAKLAAALLNGAKRLKDDADKDEERIIEDEGAFEIIDFQPMPFDFLPVGFRGYPYGAERRSGWPLAMCGPGCAGEGCCGGDSNSGAGFGRWV